MAIEKVTYVGHATVLLELGGARVLTDPVLRSRVGPLRRYARAPAPGVANGLDGVLISHLHRDHVDLASLRRVGREVPLLVPPGAAGFFERHGFSAVREVGPGESRAIGGVTVTGVEADHAGARRGAPEARAVGFLLDAGHRVYFAGDTDLFDGMATLGADRQIDLALLPVWGWGPNLGPGHLDPERAARAAALLSPRVAVPIHWGTLYPRGLAPVLPKPLRSPPREFAAHARELAPQVEVRVLSPGEATSLP
ncbi:MAG TPA: MBL fold metallo-hydrolase [Solirubrobacterales bacterium]|nr:MBL fold metallo-hydrolase [Solirubrobacterales bacterium]